MGFLHGCLSCLLFFFRLQERISKDAMGDKLKRFERQKENPKKKNKKRKKKKKRTKRKKTKKRAVFGKKKKKRDRKAIPTEF